MVPVAETQEEPRSLWKLPHQSQSPSSLGSSQVFFHHTRRVRWVLSSAGPTPQGHARLMSTEANTLQKQGSRSCLHQACYQLKSMPRANPSFMGVNIPNTCELPRSSGFPILLSR